MPFGQVRKRTCHRVRSNKEANDFSAIGLEALGDGELGAVFDIQCATDIDDVMQCPSSNAVDLEGDMAARFERQITRNGQIGDLACGAAQLDGAVYGYR